MFVIQLYFFPVHFFNKKNLICINSFYKESGRGCEAEQKTHQFKTNVKMLYFHLPV